MSSILIPSLNEIDAAAKDFIEKTSGNKVLAFYGQMGAGKTTFIKALCKQLGVKDTVNSPTFALINEYSLPDNESVFHFDFYRIKDIEEVYDLGYEDYFYSNTLCLIEWPELIENILPEESLAVKISVNEDESRTITF